MLSRGPGPPIIYISAVTSSKRGRPQFGSCSSRSAQYRAYCSNRAGAAGARIPGWVPGQMRPDRSCGPDPVAGRSPNRPPLLAQRVRFHLFLPCQHPFGSLRARCLHTAGASNGPSSWSRRTRRPDAPPGGCPATRSSRLRAWDAVPRTPRGARLARSSCERAALSSRRPPSDHRRRRGVEPGRDGRCLSSTTVILRPAPVCGTGRSRWPRPHLMEFVSRMNSHGSTGAGAGGARRRGRWRG